MTIDELDNLSRKIENNVYKETGLILTAIGVYAYNTKNDELIKIRKKIEEIIFQENFVIEMHGFYIEKAKKFIRFDVVMSFDIDQKKGLKILKSKLLKDFPDYRFEIITDIDISD